MRRKILIGVAAGIPIAVVAFLVAHALIPNSKSVSDHNQIDPAAPWLRGEPIVGAPAGLFDGTAVISDPCVLRDGKGFRMWFTLATGVGTPEQTLGIAEAQSDDGHTWRSSGQHVLAPDPAGWDAGGVETACVVQRKGGGWLMYYTGDRPPVGGHHMSIGLATSDDGLTWTRHPAGPVLEGVNEWERAFQDALGGPKIGGVLEPSVLFDPVVGRYRMWYAGLGRVAGVVQYCIGYAESDDGVNWRRDPESVFRPSDSGWDDLLVSHCHVAVGPDGKLHLFYFGSSKLQHHECETLGGCAMTPGAIGHAVSDDGRVWRRMSNLPALSPRPGEWDSWAIGGPSGLFDEGRWRLWYFGNGAHNTYKARIGTVSRVP